MLLGFVLPSPASSDAAVTPLERMHRFFHDTKDLEFETSFKVTSDLPSMGAHGTARFYLSQPGRFRVEVTSSKGEYVFVSDGATFTLYRPAQGKFARTRARDSILGTMYLATGLLNLQARLLDFLWTLDYGEDATVAAGAVEAVGNRQCQRFSVDRFEDDWDVWVEQAELPLPCRLVSRRRDGSDRISQTNEFRWKTVPAFSSETFAFLPPKGSREVGISDLD